MTHCTISHPRHYVAMKLIAPLIACLAITVLTAGAAGAASTSPPVLPNDSLTPGATNPAVTQANLRSTVCKRGWTAKVRPPESVTYPEKRASMRQYGLNYRAGVVEYDHRVPLEAGGAVNSPQNMWPEPYEWSGLVPRGQGSKTKDRLENFVNRQLCSGKITLVQAQNVFRGNWLAAARQDGLTN